MAIISGSRVKFIYVNGSELPNVVDESAVYFLSGSHQIYVGPNLIADLTDYEGIKADLVQFDTTANWSEQTTLTSIAGCLYVYTDHQTIDGVNIPGFKFGDGNAYVVDLPFSDDVYAAHIADTNIHVSAADRANWDSKVSVDVDTEYDKRLVFSN